MWDPTATSLHVRRLRSSLPETQSERCLSATGSPQTRLIGDSSLCPGSSREAGGQTSGEITSARANRRVEK
jgi:hypothetical protein